MAGTGNCNCNINITLKQAENVLKSYRRICHQINILQRLLDTEAKDIGIQRSSLDFLKKVFYQSDSINELANENNELAEWIGLKDIIDFALESLREDPDDGCVLHNVIHNLYIVTPERGMKVKYNDALEEHLKWATEKNISASPATFKKRRKAAIKKLSDFMNMKANIISATYGEYVSDKQDKIDKTIKFNAKERKKLNNSVYETTSKLYANS